MHFGKCRSTEWSIRSLLNWDMSCSFGMLRCERSTTSAPWELWEFRIVYQIISQLGYVRMVALRAGQAATDFWRTEARQTCNKEVLKCFVRLFLTLCSYDDLS